MVISNAYPPHVHHSTECITPAGALSLLSAYLTAATKDASLHPSALLTENGPTTPSSGTQNTGLVFHNLKRVEAGLRGELHLGSWTHAQTVAGWFDRQQEVTQGEIGDRVNAGGDAGDGIHVPRVQTTKSTGSKEERKKRKKEKRLQERQQQEEQKRREKQAEG